MTAGVVQRHFRVAEHTQVSVGSRLFAGGETFTVAGHELDAEIETWLRHGWTEELDKAPKGAQVVTSVVDVTDNPTVAERLTLA